MFYRTRVSDAVIRRLPMYYRHLKELEKAGVEKISSKELGKKMKFTASQIRQDINCFGGFGQQGYGYHVSDLRKHIGDILGLERSYRVVIAGAGNIGGAVANYEGFIQEGFKVVAIFDKDPKVIGTQIHGLTVKNVSGLSAWLKDNTADIGVIAVPAGNAQAIADCMTKNGIKAIWNFAPVDLVLPENVFCNHVHLSDSLHILTYMMNEDQLFQRIEERNHGSDVRI